MKKAKLILAAALAGSFVAAAPAQAYSRQLPYSFYCSIPSQNANMPWPFHLVACYAAEYSRGF